MIGPTLLDGPTSAPATGAAPHSLVILLHGYGSNGADLIGLVPYWRAALPDTLFLAPNAPQACPGAPGGRQWWPLTSLAPEARAAGVRAAAPDLNAYIDSHLAAHGLREDRAAAQRAAEAVADTLAGIHRFDNDPSPPSPESRYPVLGVRVASARNTRTSSGE